MNGENQNQRESKRILRRVEREADGARFGGLDAPQSEHDRLDALGTKIGRGLGLLVTVFLLLAIVLWFGAANPS